MLQNLTTAHKLLVVFTALYIVIFGYFYAQALNYEFLGYLVVLLLGFALVLFTIEKSQFPLYILWGLSIWGLLHMAGGSVPVGDGVLYGWRIIPIFDGGQDFFILKMDQAVHAFGFGVAALVMLHLLYKARLFEGHELLIGVTAVLAGMGLGVVNEMVEFLAVLFVPGNGVGGYFNTSLDLISNTVGAIVAVGGFYFIRKLKRES